MEQLHRSQSNLLHTLAAVDDTLLEKNVPDRKYDFKKLLYGIVQHDIYHLGQIAYILKMLRAQ